MGFFSMLGKGFLAVGRGIMKEGHQVKDDLAPYGMSSTNDLESCRDVRLLKQIKKTSKSTLVRLACERQIKELNDLSPYGMSSTSDLKSCRDISLLKQIKKTSKSTLVRLTCDSQLKKISK